MPLFTEDWIPGDGLIKSSAPIEKFQLWFERKLFLALDAFVWEYQAKKFAVGCDVDYKEAAVWYEADVSWSTDKSIELRRAVRHCKR